jgi:hypothetical protein
LVARRKIAPFNKSYSHAAILLGGNRIVTVLAQRLLISVAV